MPNDIKIPVPKRVFLNNLRIDNTNPNVMSEDNFEALKKNIQKFGFIIPIITNEDYVIADGYHRWKAARELGMSEVLVIKLPLKDVDRRMLRQILNKLRGEHDSDKDILEYNFFDESGVLEELETLLPDFSVDISSLNKEVEEDDFVPDLEKEPTYKIEKGEVWQLGEHRLMCGDSTDKDDVDKLMDGDKADMVFTDPPYRMDAEGGSNQMVGKAAAKLGENIKHLCDFEPGEFLKILASLWKNNYMNAYIFCNKDLVPDYLNWALENNYSFNILFWKKPSAIPLGGQHRPDVEYILFFRKNALWNNGIMDVNYSKCLSYGRDSSEDHPTMKPLDLIGNELKISSNKSGGVLDLFGGSGSTLIACEQLNRKCYMMELDPKYCSIIIERWESLTGKEAVKLGE